MHYLIYLIEIVLLCAQVFNFILVTHPARKSLCLKLAVLDIPFRLFFAGEDVASSFTEVTEIRRWWYWQHFYEQLTWRSYRHHALCNMIWRSLVQDGALDFVEIITTDVDRIHREFTR